MDIFKIIIGSILILVGVGICIFSWKIRINGFKKREGNQKENIKYSIKYNIVSMVGVTLILGGMLLL